MRRITVVLLLSGVLAFPASASSAVLGEYSGTISGGGTVEFKLIRKDGKKKVKGWAWNAFPVACSSGGPTSSGAFSFGMRVRHGEFRGTGILGRPSNPDAKARVEGAFSNRNANASGTFRVQGDIPEGNNCDSGTETWSATRQ